MGIKKSYRVLYLLLAVVIGSSCGSDDNLTNGEASNSNQPKEEVVLNIMTYNVKHCSPYIPGVEDPEISIEATAKAIKEGQPDVVFIQEIDRKTRRSHGIDQVIELAKLTGFIHTYFSKGQDYQGGEFGDVIFSKYPMRDVATYELPRKELEGTYVGYVAVGKATITVKGHMLSLYNTHLALDQENRDLQVPFIHKLIEKNKNLVILAGDMNATPWNSTIQQFDNLGYVRSGKGLNLFTIPSTAPTKELDFILFRPKGDFEIIEHKVITGTTASDHLPVVTTIKLN